MSKFTKYDQEMLEIIRDPVKWTEHHLGKTTLVSRANPSTSASS